MTNRHSAALLFAALANACGFEPGHAPMSFELSKRTFDATAEAVESRAKLASGLARRFGTPGAPHYPPLDAWKAEGIDPNRSEGAVGDFHPTLAASAELYRQQCLHCHGVEGGGDGPTAHFLDPHPRDVRLGVFKWTALCDQARPRRADLMRTLVEGLDGTSMPSFRRFSDAQLEGLVDYVRFLAVRGEVEKRIADTIGEDGDFEEAAFDEELEFVWNKWREAGSKVVAFDGDVPKSTPELVARGDALFHDAAKGNCSSCHGDDGRGNGPAVWKLDAFGRKTPAYLDVWGDPILPRNLTSGHFRGGSRPIDLFRRIWAGVPGGPMPALGRALDKDQERLVPDDEIWALVHYVRALGGRGDS